MNGKLTALVDYLAGQGGEGADLIRSELADPASEASQFLGATQQLSRNVLGPHVLKSLGLGSDLTPRQPPPPPSGFPRVVPWLVTGSVCVLAYLLWPDCRAHCRHLEAEVARLETELAKQKPVAARVKALRPREVRKPIQAVPAGRKVPPPLERRVQANAADQQTALVKDLTAARTEVQRTREQLRKARAEVHRSEQQLAEVRVLAASQKRTLQKVEAHVQRLEKDREAVPAQRLLLTNRLAAVQALVKLRERQLAQAKDQAAQWSTALGKVRGNVKSLTGELQAVRDLAAWRLTALRKARAERDRLRKLLKKAQGRKNPHRASSRSPAHPKRRP